MKAWAGCGLMPNSPAGSRGIARAAQDSALDSALGIDHYVQARDRRPDCDMSAKARLVVQMTPAEKRALERRARQAGLTTSEFVRGRVSGDDLDQHREEIEAFLIAIENAGPSILRKLDAAISSTDSITAAIAAFGAKPCEEDSVSK
jgi:hypothetical protein